MKKRFTGCIVSVVYTISDRHIVIVVIDNRGVCIALAVFVCLFRRYLVEATKCSIYTLYIYIEIRHVRLFHDPAGRLSIQR
jgi:hypothetical protein